MSTFVNIVQSVTRTHARHVKATLTCKYSILRAVTIAVIMSLHWVSRSKRLDTQRGNQMNLITFQAAYHIE
jgi:hypothetical protein